MEQIPDLKLKISKRCEMVKLVLRMLLVFFYRLYRLYNLSRIFLAPFSYLERVFE